MVKIATWNLQRGGDSRGARAGQEAVLRDVGADVLILTEPGAAYVRSSGVVTSPPLRPDVEDSEAWVAIVGSSVDSVTMVIPYERMAVAATASVKDAPVVVYGSVLPWSFIGRDSPELVRNGETAFEAFVRLLSEQVADLEALRRAHPDHLLIWAGDFNQTLSGPNHGGSEVKRAAVLEVLDRLDLVAFNGGVAGAAEGMHAIDLVCGPRETEVVRQSRIAPTLEGVRLSDHAGYCVEIATPT